jgi:hypothetical protein
MHMEYCAINMKLEESRRFIGIIAKQELPTEQPIRFRYINTIVNNLRREEIAQVLLLFQILHIIPFVWLNK